MRLEKCCRFLHFPFGDPNQGNDTHKHFWLEKLDYYIRGYYIWHCENCEKNYLEKRIVSGI